MVFETNRSIDCQSRHTKSSKLRDVVVLATITCLRDVTSGTFLFFLLSPVVTSYSVQINKDLLQHNAHPMMKETERLLLKFQCPREMNNVGYL